MHARFAGCSLKRPREVALWAEDPGDRDAIRKAGGIVALSKMVRPQWLAESDSEYSCVR